MLTADDKNAIQQSGEITRQIEFNDPASHRLLKGKLRILKTENPHTLNFVEIGEWISQGCYPISGQSNELEFRDRLVYDENGNALSRRKYEKHGEQFQIREEWTSEFVEGRFLQHVKIYEEGVLVAEYTRNVLNYSEPKSDLQKNKIPFGTDKVYYPNGNLAYVMSYDDNGQLIVEEKHKR